MKYKANFERDWLFYCNNKNKFNFAPDYLPQLQYDVDGKDAKYCFWLFDSTGKLVPCNQPELLTEVLVCKKSINFHIKLWVDNYMDLFLPIQHYLNEFVDPPTWIEQALVKQLNKKYDYCYPSYRGLLNE